MDPYIIFKCLQNKKSLKTFIKAVGIISLIFVVFSISLSLITTRPFPTGNIMDVILFGLFKAFLSFLVLDWVIFIGFIIFGSLLYANYEYWKCPSKKSGHVGIMAGLVTATCPACILPVLGLSAIAVGVSTVTTYIKIGLLVGLLAMTYIVVYKQKSCKITK